MKYYEPKSAALMEPQRVVENESPGILELPSLESESGEKKEVFEYFYGLKDAAPFFDHRMGTNMQVVCWQKYNMPPEYSNASNIKKYFPAGLPKIILTEDQAEAIRNHTAKIKIHVPERYNWKSTKDNGIPPKLSAQTCILGDWIILEKKGEFNPLSEVYQVPESVEPKLPKTEDENLKDELYKAQAKKGKSKK